MGIEALEPYTRKLTPVLDRLEVIVAFLLSLPELLRRSNTPHNRRIAKVAALLAWVFAVQAKRAQQQQEIATLAARVATGKSPISEAWRVVYLLTCRELPLLSYTSNLQMLLKISAATAVSEHRAMPAQSERLPAEDFELLLREITEHIYTSPRGAAAVTALKELKQAYQLTNETALYMLALCVVSLPNAAEKFGWRSVSALEKEALATYWRAVGEQLEIHDIPSSFLGMKNLIKTYESKVVQPTAHSATNLRHTLDATFARAPLLVRLARPLVQFAVLSFLPAAHQRAFKLSPRPPAGQLMLSLPVKLLNVLVVRLLLLPTLSPMPRTNATMVQTERGLRYQTRWSLFNSQHSSSSTGYRIADLA
ncbi:hypothetical protein RI367_005728 [Sorochytrium milnesiophthora]